MDSQPVANEADDKENVVNTNPSITRAEDSLQEENIKCYHS